MWRSLYTQGLVSFANEEHRPNDFCVSQFNVSTAQTVALIEETNAYATLRMVGSTPSRTSWTSFV